MKNKHRNHLISSCLVVTAAAFLLVLGVEARTWTSADGSKTFEGELKSYDAASGKVSVTLPNRKRMTFTQDKLSAEDIAWLQRITRVVGQRRCTQTHRVVCRPSIRRRHSQCQNCFGQSGNLLS